MTEPMTRPMWWDEDAHDFYCGVCGAACEPRSPTDALAPWVCLGEPPHLEGNPIVRQVPGATLARLHTLSVRATAKELLAEWRTWHAS